MQKNILSVEINKPASEVFEFALNPDNTPHWIEDIVHEEIDTPVPVLGTHYRNKSVEGVWNEYEVTEFKPNNLFIFKQVAGQYSVRYDFDSTGSARTRLTYTEWVDTGELENPFTMAPLEKLKAIVESL